MRVIIVSKSILSISFAFLIQGVFSQQMKIVPPTPNAMKMTEYHSEKPNMYTGTASVNIPLYTIDFDGWKLPLSLSYYATGIRTNEEASEVGLGWSMNATGVISRTIRGGDDLSPGGFSGGKGYVYNEYAVRTDPGYAYNHSASTIPPVDSYYNYLVQAKPDTQPDIFNYNFFGYSGSFTLSQKIVNGVIKAIKLTGDACSVLFDESGKSFTVITPDGFQGKFDITERSTSFSAGPITTDRLQCCGENFIDIQQVKNDARFRTVTSWYLSTITSPRGDQITFGYDYQNPDGSSRYLSNSKSFAELESLTDQITGGTTNETCLQTVHEYVYLKEIIGPDVKVVFSMENRMDIRKNRLLITNLRKEFPLSEDLKRYTGFTVTGQDPASTLNKSITFVQNYFNHQYANGSTPDSIRVLWLRSRLDRVKIDDQEYRFTYEEGLNGLPHKLTTGIDHFGFYNGVDGNKSLYGPFITSNTFCDPESTPNETYYRQLWERRVDFGYGKAGLLKTLRYPTRGYSLFEFESHKYLPNVNVDTAGQFLEEPGEKLGGGARILSLKEYDYANNLLRQKTYRYQESGDISPTNNSVTTGKLMTPLLNRYIRRLWNDQGNKACYFLYASNSSIPGNNSAEGKIIGYSKVHEVVVGSTDNYKNTYYFENVPNQLYEFNVAVINNANANGQAKEIRNYNSEGKVVQVTANQDYKHTIGDPVKGISYKNYASQTWLYYYVPYTINRTFNRPYTVITTTAEAPSGLTEDVNGNLSAAPVIQTHTTSSYNPNFLIKSQQTINSNGKIVKSEYKRTGDYTTPIFQTMASETINQVETVVEEINYRDNIIVSATLNQFQQYLLTNRFDLKSTHSYNKDLGNFIDSPDGVTVPANFEKKIDFTLYAPNGKILEYRGSDGTINSFIWGYNGKLPVVHGAGILYNKLISAHTAAIGSNNYDATLRNNADIIGKQVSTFVHNPQIGLSKVTDPTGIKRMFNYDLYGRLEKVVDNDGKTIEQYKYHFKEMPQTRILSVSGDLNFGTLFPGYDDVKPDWYVNCSTGLGSRVLTLTNNGEDDLHITNITLPSGFNSEWRSGTIAAGTSIKTVIKFASITAGNYGGTVIIDSDETSASQPVPISGTFANRICNMSVSSTLVDFGTITDGFAQQSLTITNNGNTPVKLADVLLNWNGNINYTISEGIFPDFSVTRIPTCLGVGQSANVQVAFVPKAYGPTQTKLSLIVDECLAPGYKDIVILKGNRQPLTSTISMDTSPINFGSFTEINKTQTITISNPGTLGFTFTGLDFSNPSVASYFTATPSNVMIPPGESRNVELTFQPPVFGGVSTDIIFQNDAMTGNETVAFTGNRYSSRKMVLSATELLFDYTGEQQTITITNSGNDNLSIDGFSPSNASLQQWAASLTPVLLAPGASTNMQIVRTGSTPIDQTITILSNKNEGVNAFVVKGRTKIVGVSPSSVSIPAFTDVPISPNFTVTNIGTNNLVVDNITSSDSRFIASPTSFTIIPGGNQVVSITYVPTDFQQQSSTLIIISNATSGNNTLSVTGQRTMVYQLTPSTGSVNVKPFATPQSIYLYNTGNTDVTINSILNSHPANYAVLSLGYSGVIYVPTSLPYVVTPGSSLLIEVRSANGNYNGPAGLITIFDSQGGTYPINVSQSNQ